MIIVYCFLYTFGKWQFRMIVLYLPFFNFELFLEIPCWNISPKIIANVRSVTKQKKPALRCHSSFCSKVFLSRIAWLCLVQFRKTFKVWGLFIGILTSKLNTEAKKQKLNIKIKTKKKSLNLVIIDVTPEKLSLC